MLAWVSVAFIMCPLFFASLRGLPSSRLLFLVVGVLWVQNLRAQPNPELGLVEQALDPRLEEHVEGASKASLANYRGEHSKELRKLYGDRDAQLLARYEESGFKTDEYWQAWIDGLLSHIAEANPGKISPRQRVYINRGTSVNARCYGNGVAAIDMGLLARLSSEDEVAFVLCHELAHQILDHVDNRYAAYVDLLFDRETQKTLRRLRRQSFGGYQEYLDLTESLSFEFSRHSRYGEIAADSLGVALYQAAGFGVDGPVNVMRVLAKADSSAYADSLDLVSALSVPDYPAKTRWFKQYQSTFLLRTDTLTQAERDSLRTHPDTELRTEKLRLMLGGYQPGLANAQRDDYTARRQVAQRELVAGAFDADRLDLALYYALRGLERHPDDAWYRGTAALSLSFLAQARSNTHFSQVAPMPSSMQDPHRRALSEVLHRMRGKDMRDLAFHYAVFAREVRDTPEAAMALIVAADLDPDRSKAARLARSHFRKTYPRHPYAAWLMD